MDLLYIIAAAFFMDLLFGDPRWRYHPVRIMGKLISAFEKVLYRLNFKKIAGFILVLLVIIHSYVAVKIILRVANHIHPLLGSFISVFLIYSCLSIKDLKDESMSVYHALVVKNISLARQKVSQIVGRDTENLNDNEITRATVETIAESTLDGVISPLFYAFLGGVHLAIIYKIVNTMDSMIGHANQRYMDFGWAAAKTDEIFNFAPSRICAILFFLRGIVQNKKSTFKILNLIKNKSFIIDTPSMIPQAAMAVSLSVKLGGVNYYNDKKIIVPDMGQDNDSLDLDKIKQANNIMYVVSFIGLFLGCAISWLIRR